MAWCATWNTNEWSVWRKKGMNILNSKNVLTVFQNGFWDRSAQATVLNKILKPVWICRIDALTVYKEEEFKAYWDKFLQNIPVVHYT